MLASRVSHLSAPFFVLLLQLVRAAAEPFPSQKDILPAVTTDSVIHEMARDFMKDPVKIGLSVGVIKNGITFVFHFGSVQMGSGRVPDDQTLYEIGSVTKTFTGMLLAQAIVENKISLDDDVRKYLSGEYPGLVYQDHAIRIRNLVNHTSGLPLLMPDIPDLFRYGPDSVPGQITALYRDYTQEEFFKDLQQVQLHTLPGSRFSYSNVDAQLAGFILEKVYGKPYAALVGQYIFRPLGMDHSCFSLDSDLYSHAAKGHNGHGIVVPYNHPLSILQPAGGICSTVTDMLKYLETQLNGNNRIASISHEPSCEKDGPCDFGLFWQIDHTYDKKRFYWHSGATFGFSAVCALYPDSDAGIIVLSNEYDMNSIPEIEEFTRKLYRRLSGIW